MLQDGEKLFESLMAVNELYHPDGQPVVFDLQIEAEILGCELLWSDDTPPSVVSHDRKASSTAMAQASQRECLSILPTAIPDFFPIRARAAS